MYRLFLVLTVLLGFGGFMSGCDMFDDDDDDSDGSGTDTVRVQDTSYHPAIVPSQFVDTITNPYWPMKAGSVFIYAEVDSDSDSVEVDTADLGDFTGNIVMVLDTTKEIMGVTTTVVWDREYDSGEVVEETFDWYAQHQDGTVWYFGEDTKELENGQVVSTEGSWQAGVDGAQPGIIMQNDPQPGPAYRQEYYFDVAEDWGQVVERLDSLETGLDTYEDVVKIREVDSLVAGSEEFKYYAPGVGLIREEKAGPDSAVVELIEFTAP